MMIEKLLDLAPGAGNPRNSEGSFLKLKDGRIAFVYSRYKGGDSDDHAYAEIAVIFYDGESFTEPRILACPDETKGEINNMSVSCLRLPDGDAAVFYLIKYAGVSSEYVMRRSKDELLTLEEPTLCVSPDYKGYYVVNNDRVALLSDGRLMVTAARHPATMGFRGRGDRMDGRGKAIFYASSDGGATWSQLSEEISLPGGVHSGSGLQEPGVLELPNGTLYAYFRTDLGRQYESFSADGGYSWTIPQPSAFTSPCSPLLIKKNPFSGKFVAVWNPTPESPCRYLLGEPQPKIWTGGRTPLVMAESDDGLHFGEPSVIESDPKAGFCYPAILFTGEKEMLLAYCAGGVEETDVSCLVRLRISRVAW